jgi:hypothetical protein
MTKKIGCTNVIDVKTTLFQKIKKNTTTMGRGNVKD